MLDIVQQSEGRSLRFRGEPRVHPFVDLIIADIPEGLPVPGVSDPPTSIPSWNIDTDNCLQPIFDFADNHLHDDGAVILFHPFRASTKGEIFGYCDAFEFEVRKEWWGTNKLHLTSPINPTLTVSSLLGHPLVQFVIGISSAH